jgi:hypothetical protein
VIASPSALSAQGTDFSTWLRPLPRTYTRSFAGYWATGGPFRYVATTLVIPPKPQPGGNGGTAAISLGRDGGATPRPYARIEVIPGGGPGSIRYTTSTSTGAFTGSPRPGDRVVISIYYDQHGHDLLFAADTTRGLSQTITKPASPVISAMPYNIAWLAAMIDNTTVTPPPADAQIWAFSGSHVTTYHGDRGTILGHWATTQYADTTTGTPAGKVVMNAPALTNNGQNFGVWLRHR